MDKEIVIKAEGLGKAYKLYGNNKTRIIEAIDPFHKARHSLHHALHDLNLEVTKGEALGIIGVNGSGKSTLLKILTGVVTPTEGTISVNGKISALLELGAGFNPDYTGMENIYLNGTMMGYTPREMDKKVQEIVDFADIGAFINQPVKTYSSGMFARLAFSVAISVDPDILVVDEALSVGDIFFQTKCFKKFNSFVESGKTVLFVSHDLGSIYKYCNRVILLNKGEKIADGNPKEVIDIYKKLLTGNKNAQSIIESGKGISFNSIIEKHWKNMMVCNPEVNEYGDKRVEIVDFAVIDKDDCITNTISKGDSFMIKIRVCFNADIVNPIIAFTIKNKQGVEIAGTNTDMEEQDIENAKAGKYATVSFSQKMLLQGGEYLLSFGCTGYEGDQLVVYHRLYDICNIVVVESVRKVGFFDMESECVVEED